MIRAYRADDLDEVLALFRESVHCLAAGDYTAEQLAAWAPETPDREAWKGRLATGHTLVAEDEGYIAGFVRAEERGYVDLLYVHPQCAGRRIGSQLIQRMLDWLREQGATRAWTHASHTARPVFESAGFRVEQRRTVRREGVDIDHWAMARSLQD